MKWTGTALADLYSEARLSIRGLQGMRKGPPTLFHTMVDTPALADLAHDRPAAYEQLVLALKHEFPDLITSAADLKPVPPAPAPIPAPTLRRAGATAAGANDSPDQDDLKAAAKAFGALIRQK